MLAGASGEVGHGHKVIKQGIENGCFLSSCWRPYEGTEGGNFCAYGRGADLALEIMRSPRAARRFVAAEISRAHLKKTKKPLGPADLAAVRSNAKQAIVLLAVGRNTARLILSAESDNDSSPTWPGVRAEAIDDAINVAYELHRPGCPASLAKC
jgi:hypothetical protein